MLFIFRVCYEMAIKITSKVLNSSNSAKHEQVKNNVRFKPKIKTTQP